MLKAILAYVSTGAVFLALDFVWLSKTGNMLYRPLIGGLMADSFRVAPAILFYALYIAGTVVLAVMPALASGRFTTALLYGAMLGLVAYGTYDLTNQSILKTWPTVITVADMCWGTVLTAIAATLGFFITRHFLGRPGG